MSGGFMFAVVLVACSLVSAQWIPVSPDDIKRAAPTDIIDIVHLEAPLLEWKFGPILGYMNLYHTALGFHNRNTGANWSIEYDATPNIFYAFIPYVEKLANGTTVLKWQNGGGAFLYSNINATYWTKHRDVVGQINGTGHNNYLEWIKSFNATHEYYNLFNVMSKWGVGGKSFLDGYTCADFVWTGFQKLYQFGAKYNTADRKKNNVNFYVSEAPVKVEYEEYRQEINDYFEFISLQFKKLDILEILDALEHLFTGKIFLHHDNDYYMLKLHVPNFNWKYEPEPLPPGKPTMLSAM